MKKKVTNTTNNKNQKDYSYQSSDDQVKLSLYTRIATPVHTAVKKIRNWLYSMNPHA
jgi:hypothetical protein